MLRAYRVASARRQRLQVSAAPRRPACARRPRGRSRRLTRSPRRTRGPDSSHGNGSEPPAGWLIYFGGRSRSASP
jgi:hypothetical protein